MQGLVDLGAEITECGTELSEAGGAGVGLRSNETITEVEAGQTLFSELISKNWYILSLHDSLLINFVCTKLFSVF